MADYAEANSIVAVNKDENIIAQKMAQLNQLLTEVTGSGLRLRIHLNKLRLPSIQSQPVMMMHRYRPCDLSSSLFRPNIRN